MRLPSRFNPNITSGGSAGNKSEANSPDLSVRRPQPFKDKLVRLFLQSRRLYFSAVLLVLTPQVTASEQLLTQAWQDVQQLSSDEMAGRYPGSVGHQRAQQYILQRFAAMQLQPLHASYRQPFQFKSGLFSQSSGTNLVATITGCTFPEAYVVVTAHYDHLAASGSKIFNGADDNASGVAGLLYLAGKLQPACPAYSYIFIATDAEEQGLDGARAWLKQTPIPLAQIMLNINLDMISRGERRQRLYLAGKRTLPELQEIPSRQHQKVKLVLGHEGRSRQGMSRSAVEVDWSNASDHAVFRRAGIPYMYFGVDVHRHYHTADDDWQNIDPEFFKSALQLIHSSLSWVEQQPPAVFITARRPR